MCTLEPTLTALCSQPSPGTRTALSPTSQWPRRLDPEPALPSTLTGAQEEHVIGVVQAAHTVDGHTLVAGPRLQQQQVAADLPVHQEVVFEEVQHAVRELQGRGDLPLPGAVGDALGEEGAA